MYDDLPRSLNARVLVTGRRLSRQPPVREAAGRTATSDLPGQFLHRARSGTSRTSWATHSSRSCATMSRSPTTPRWIESSTWPARPAPRTTSTTRCRPRRPPCTVRSTCWVWPSGSGPDPAGLHQRGLRRSRGAPQTESYWGKVNPIGIRSCYDEGKRCAETLFFDYWRQNKVDIKVVRIFNTYGPRMHPHDGRVVSNFIVQASRERTSRSTATGRRPGPSATWTT